MLKTQSNADRVVRTAAWFYLAPRVAVLWLVIAAFTLAGFLVVTPLLRAWLQQHGA